MTFEDRTICIVLPGHSVDELDRRINEFSNANVLWGSLNQFWDLEPIIRKIGRTFDFVYAMHTDFEKYRGMYEGFSHRGCLITRHRVYRRIKYANQQGNSLFGLLIFCIEQKAKKVYLFGADGYSDENLPYFSGMTGENNPDFVSHHKTECEQFNRTFPKDTGTTKIFNVSTISHYDTFPRITYDQALEGICQ